MSKLKKWLYERFLPAWCRDDLMRANELLSEKCKAQAREALRVCGVLGRMYKIYSGPDIDPAKDVVISWGNGILYDEDQTWADYKDMVARGLLKPEIAVGWYFDMPIETEADLKKVREKYMPEIQAMEGAGDE